MPNKFLQPAPQHALHLIASQRVGVGRWDQQGPKEEGSEESKNKHRHMAEMYRFSLVTKNGCRRSCGLRVMLSLKMVVVKHVVAGLRGQHFLRVAKRKIIAFPALPITVFGFNSNFAQISIWEIPSQLEPTESETN